MPGAVEMDTKMVQAPATNESLEEDFQRKGEEMRRVAKDCVLVIDNIPKIGGDKYQKLFNKLNQTFEKYGRLRRDSNDAPLLSLVQDPSTGQTLGYAFVQFITPEEAHKAMLSLHNLQFDRSHRFWACTAGDLERLQNVDEKFIPPPAPPVTRLDRPNFKSWLLDSRGRDQFMIRHEDTTSIYWHDHIIKPQLDYARMMWTESHSMWSPKGTYLASFHPRGIKLWGRVDGKNGNDNEEGQVEWVFVMRFEHNNVSLIDFSPCENYLVTFNGTEPERDDKRNPRALIVWDVLTGRKRRGFMGPPRTMIGPDGSIPWPIFQWSSNDKYFGRINENAISIYQTPEMGLLDKKSFKIPNVQRFAWSPVDTILAYWTPEVADSPARVTLIDIPSRKEIRQKALFSVSSIVLHWQQEGKFLCCKVDRLTKSKKNQYSNFELFRVKAKDIPVEVLEYKEKDTVQAFGWEPQGNRFAVIHGLNETPNKTDVSMYTMEGVQGELKKLFTLENKPVNEICWSPRGRFLLLAAMGTRSGNLEWYDVNDMVNRNSLNPLGTSEHFQCNDISWDPSGRFVATCVTYWRNISDNAYVIWTMYGKEICRVNVDQLYQFIWRPRPVSLLSSEQERKVKKKSMKERKERYEKEDKDLRDSVSSGKAAQRKEQRDVFITLRKKYEEGFEKEQERRRAVMDVFYGDSDDIMQTITEVMEIALSVKEEIDRTRKLLTSDDERD